LTPGVPLATLSTAIADVETAYAVWAPIGSRGSHSEYLDLKNKSLILYNLLLAEADYVYTTSLVTAGNDYSVMGAIIGTSGYALKKVPSPQGVLPAPVGFRKVIATNLNPNQVKFSWEKPLEARRGNVQLYRVLRGTTSNFADALQIATTTRTSFIDTNDAGSVQTYTYWVIAVNNAGDGASSDAVTVSILA